MRVFLGNPAEPVLGMGWPISLRLGVAGRVCGAGVSNFPAAGEHGERAAGNRKVFSAHIASWDRVDGIFSLTDGLVVIFRIMLL